MPLFEYPELAFAQLALLVLSGIWLLRRNDEIPLLISGFMFYVASYRYWAVTSGINNWVNLSHFGFVPVTTDTALRALAYIVFGQICLLATYMLRQKKILPLIVAAGDYPFLQWLRPKIILFGLFCLPLVVITRSSVIAQARAGRSLAFEISGYLRLFPLVLIGIATLILCVWKFGGLASLQTKIAAIAILSGVAYFTFSPSGRFQFLGWVVASAVILSSSYRLKTRLVVLASVAVLGMSMFALAGAMRSPELAGDALNQATWERSISAEDANMLDGFAILQSVYPQHLDFRWGMEHLEILMRPIPRAWWPEKPVGGGYMLQFGLSNPDKGSTLGFSPSLFGSFYAEGGIIGIFFFSLLYGVILAAVVRYSTRLQPFASLLVRAILCASLIPLLRGGDLPGIYAWIGMAFWPCFLLLWIKRSELRLRFPSSDCVHILPRC